MRNTITKTLQTLEQATAKNIAEHSGLEFCDVIKELIAMQRDAIVESEKLNGNRYTYRLSAAAQEILQFIPSASAESAQPASGANNPGSSGTDSLTGTTSSPGAAATIQDDAEQRIDVIGQNGNEGLHYGADNIHAEHAAELQAALDEIDRLKRQLATTLEPKNWNPASMLAELQTYLEDGVFVTIGYDNIRIGWGDNLFDAGLHEFVDVVDMCADLERRLVA